MDKIIIILNRHDNFLLAFPSIIQNYMHIQEKVILVKF